jgi:DNA-binding CsgD family transcriptional regulator
MLSIQPEEQYALRAFRLGASGCLNKSGAPDELIEAIRAVASGGTYVSPAASGVLVSGIKRGDGQAPHLLLSEREHQVMLLLANGRTVGEVASGLNLSVKTVSTYRARILEKMNLANNAQLTQYAYRHKLINCEHLAGLHPKTHSAGFFPTAKLVCRTKPYSLFHLSYKKLVSRPTSHFQYPSMLGSRKARKSGGIVGRVPYSYQDTGSSRGCGKGSACRFLSPLGLELEADVELSAVVEDNGEPIATASLAGRRDQVRRRTSRPGG